MLNVYLVLDKDDKMFNVCVESMRIILLEGVCPSRSFRKLG